MGEVLPLRREPTASPELLWRQAIGAQLRDERSDRNERLADVAGRAGVSTQYLSELERGLKEPSSEVLAALAGSLDLSVFALTTRAAARLTGRSSRWRDPVLLAA